MQEILQQFLNLEIMLKVWPLLLGGFYTTLYLCLLVIPLGLAGGLLLALLLLTRNRLTRFILYAIVDLVRAAPPLVLLILFYSGLPFAGIRLSPTAAVCLAFFCNTSSYYGEIYRAGIESIGRGQWEAARSTGLNGLDTLAWVVLPQAVRNVLPDLVSNTIEVVKLTSIASVVSFPELLYSADMARSLTFNSSPVVLAAALYLLFLWPLVRLVARLERRVATHLGEKVKTHVPHRHRCCCPAGRHSEGRQSPGCRRPHARADGSGQGQRCRSRRLSRAGADDLLSALVLRGPRRGRFLF
jgi:polar amino acid transport system permease protein